MKTLGWILLVGTGFFLIYYFFVKKINTAEEKTKGAVEKATAWLSPTGAGSPTTGAGSPTTGTDLLKAGGLAALLGLGPAGLIVGAWLALVAILKKKEAPAKAPPRKLVALSFEISPGHFRSIPTKYKVIE